MSRDRTAEAAMVATSEAGDNRRGKLAHKGGRFWEGMHRNDESCRIGARARWGRSRPSIFRGEV